MNGEIYGECHRKALLRYLGVETDKSEDSLDNFDGGFNNEYTWEKYLAAALKDSVILQKDYPVSWEVVEGKSGEGSADLTVLAKDADSTVQYGIELKGLVSVDSAIGVFCEDRVDVKHLIQAAHYALRSGVPFTLIYTYRSISVVPYWAKKYTLMLRKKKNTDYLYPFTKEYPIGFDAGKVYYMVGDKKVLTKITVDGINDYYKLILEMEEKKELYHRVTKLDLAGAALPWDPCGFCPFKDACDDFETNFDAWLDKAKLLAGASL